MTSLRGTPYRLTMALALGVSAGCEGKSESAGHTGTDPDRMRTFFSGVKREQIEHRLTMLRLMYVGAQNGLGRPPGSREELFQAVPYAKADNTWESNRDDQPFQVRWGTPVYKEPRRALMWEASAGPDGKRAVLTSTDDAIQWLADDELDRLRK